jgi:hypothetical protein
LIVVVCGCGLGGLTRVQVDLGAGPAPHGLGQAGDLVVPACALLVGEADAAASPQRPWRISEQKRLP